jgi:RNA polymerase sigma-70 factor (ECF subfamily)
MADTHRSTEVELYRIIEAEIPRLRRYARALTQDFNVADELVQDCLVRGLGNLHLRSGGTDVSTWLFAILYDQYVNQVRQAGRLSVATGLDETEPGLTRVSDRDGRLELQDLGHVLAKLPKEQHAVILLVGLEGLSYEEVAQIIGVSVGTVRSRLSRGRNALRRLMGVAPDGRAEAVPWAAANATRAAA